ncbi:MAG: hypothetical protein B5M56_08850 [Desulfococcus sp. 4484_241]|nr:MAG: hypothetical protein B5M56_08850 [Desulfococcus sp. 4484_241]
MYHPAKSRFNPKQAESRGGAGATLANKLTWGQPLAYNLFSRFCFLFLSALKHTFCLYFKEKPLLSKINPKSAFLLKSPLNLVQKKKTPGSLAFGFPCKIACRGVAGNSLRSNSPATSPPVLQFCFGCAAWDKRPHSHNNKDRLVGIWDLCGFFALTIYS